MTEKKDHALRATLSVTLIVFISKAVGYVRTMVNGYYFGQSAESGAYFSAYSIYMFPILLFTSCITSTLVPMYLDAKKSGGVKAANRFGSNSINVFALASMLLSILMYILAEPLVRLVYRDFAPEPMRMTIEMTRIMMPSLVFVTISIVQSSIMNARERYIAGQLSGFPYSLATIIAMVLFAESYGIYAVAWATAAAGLLQVLVVIPFQRGVFKYSFRFDITEPRIKRMILLAVPSMASMAVSEINHMFDQFMASGFGASAVAAMNYGSQMITLIIGVVSVPIITVMFSRMSARAAEHNHQAIIDMVMQCIEVICMILLPVIVLGGVFSVDVYKVMYMRGAFDIEAVRVTAPIFVMYLLGVIFYSLRDLFNRAFHSIQNTRIPLYTALLTLALNIVGNIVLSRLMGLSGLALSTAISSGFGAFLLFYLLRGKLGRMRYRDTLGEILKYAVASAVCLVLSLLLNRYVPETVGTVRVLFRLILCVLPCALVYLGLLYALRARQLSFLKQMLSRRGSAG